MTPCDLSAPDGSVAGVKRAALAADASGAGPHADEPCAKKLKRDEELLVEAGGDAGEKTPTATTATSMFFAAERGSILLRRERLAAAEPEHKHRVLSPLDIASAEQVRQHLRDVRREVFLRPLVAIITRLMFHKYNHGLFNVRVDPVAWNIPHYLEMVKHPMDLSLVKNKCLNLEYATADECAADIRLVFTNACLFNPTGHPVHEAAKVLLSEFEAEFSRYQLKIQASERKRDEHSCPSCLANVCGICNQKCINFEPPFVMCSGPCQQRIKRHSLYFMTPDRSHHWCGKCYTSLPKLLSLKMYPASNQASAAEVPQSQELQVPKSSLVKAKFLDELTEPWVQCDKCNGWVHQICALFNACEDSEDDDDMPFTCPVCRVDELELAEQDWDVEMSPSETSVDEFPLKTRKYAFEVMGSHSPILKRKPTPKEFTRVLGFDTAIEEKVFDYLGDEEMDKLESLKTAQIEGFVSSRELRSCALSRFMQSWVHRHLVELGEHEAAQSINIKVVSSLKSSCQVSPVVREHFRSEALSYPQAIEFSSKAIFVFQKINGIEVCIFSMYVQEYDRNSTLAANRNRTYIAYIDSLVYMRPRHVRTSLFHETLIAYLAFCKGKGFHHAHIWACPTTRGGDFIYWCHPTFQKNPGKDRLLQWYLKMAEVGKKAEVVFACQDLYACEFENLEDRLQHQLPPYFDGDYWSAEAERLAASPPKRGRLSKEAYEASLKGESFRKKVVNSVKASRDSLFVISLQPSCSVCGSMMVNASCWKQEGATPDEDRYTCSSCYKSSTAESPTDAPMTEVQPPSFVQSVSETEPEVEIKCPFLDHRPDMLKNCEEHHYQFDSYRRAKYSTMMLIYQISSTQHK
ncbi:Histone acetyltransferase [Globisporangium polare]